jgi:MftR C-terminal domain
MRPEVVADQNFRAEKQRTHMQVIASNPALGARALQDLLAAERVVAAAIAADLGVDQTDLQPQVAAAAVNARRGTLSAAASHHPRSWAAQAPSGDAGPGDEVAQPGTW